MPPPICSTLNRFSIFPGPLAVGLVMNRGRRILTLFRDPIKTHGGPLHPVSHRTAPVLSFQPTTISYT